MKNYHSDLATVILAGGESRRMQGTNKLSLQLGDRTLLQWSMYRLQKQSSRIIMSVPFHQTQTTDTDIPVIVDTCTQETRGPLQGLLSSMQWLKAQPNPPKWLVTTPADCPFIPYNLVESLFEAVSIQNQHAAYAYCEDRAHYLCSIWSISLMQEVHTYLEIGERSAKKLLLNINASPVHFEGKRILGYDPFFNINTPDDFKAAQALMTFIHKG